MSPLGAAGIAFAIAALGCFAIFGVGPVRRLVLQDPTEDRWHRVATPSYGGVAMFLGFAVAALVVAGSDSTTWRLVAGGGAMFVVGLVDDVATLSPKLKFGGQLVAAAVMVALGLELALPGGPLVTAPLSVIWIVAIANAVNLLDNMDGLAGGVSLAAASTLWAWAAAIPEVLPEVAAAALVGALIGFLIFNVNPARIFMGDAGSLWLGATLAALSLLDGGRGGAETVEYSFLALVVPVVLLAVPVFDTALVAIERRRHGRPISQGGRDHSSHRLVAKGLSDRVAVGVLWLLATLGGGVASVANATTLGGFLGLAGLYWGALAFIAAILAGVAVYGEVSPPEAPRTRPPAAGG